ncbi:hypothetical protein [Actinomadura sp. 6N118]|uniref:hypothetical protein n=1 Tax=Actinomadura sp. 6N118 TaxID=3375151 RepID=UPI0037A5BE79
MVRGDGHGCGILALWGLLSGCEAEAGEAAAGILEMPPVGPGDVGPPAEFQDANPITARDTDSASRGGSVWTVNSAGKGLERRVDETTTDAFLRAIAPADMASAEIAAAWAAVYGRNPDPSDGWDHAIKAVEELLIPIVVLNQQKANLGGVAGELKANPFEMVVRAARERRPQQRRNAGRHDPPHLAEPRPPWWRGEKDAHPE